MKTDLQRVHDELRGLLAIFDESRMMGDRVVRVARIEEKRVYELYDLLKEIRVKHELEDRS